MAKEENGKVRLLKREWLAFIVSSIFIAGGFFQVTNFRVNALAKDAEKCSGTNEVQEKAITTVQSDIKHIRSDIDSIHKEQSAMNTKIDESNKLLYRILGKLDSDDSALLRGSSYAGDRPIIK